jgi:SdrD B-like domain
MKELSTKFFSKTGGVFAFFFLILLLPAIQVNAQCTCTGNLVLNPSFESGITSWSSSGGTLSAGTGAVKCGSFSGDFQISNTSSNYVSQTIGTDLPIGTVINASVWAGTHNNTYNHIVVIDFFDANWVWISGSSVQVDKVLATTPTGPQLYTWSGTVPPNCKYTQVGFSGNGDWIKTDQWCVTTAAPTTVALGNEVFIDTNGNGVKDGGDWGYDGALVKLYLDANQDNIPDGVALASQTTTNGGKYNFTNLAPGNYMVQIESTPSWMFITPKNGGDPDNDIDNDNNGLSQTGSIIKGGTITLTLGGEPGASSSNATYDFAIYKNNGLGDFVFLDADADGVQDAGEVGLSGVTVRLKNTAGTILATTTSDATGYYYFYDPAQYGTNTYNIEFVTPSGYTPSPSNQGADDTKDSDPVGGVISNVNVPNGTWNYTLDAGFYSSSCSCPGANVVLNASFESGTTNWSWSGGTLAQGTGGVACGTYSGDLNNTSTTSKAWQNIGTNLAVGTTISASVYAGTHDNTFNNYVAIEFLDAGNVVLGSSVYVQVDKILANAPAGPQLYTINSTVPSGAVTTRVAFGGNGSYTKVDQWCVSTTPPATCNARVTSLYFNKLDGGVDLPITNGASFTSAQLGSLYNLEAGTTGTVGSVKYTITGPTPSTNIENTTPYNSPGTGGGAWTGAAGTYNINLKTYSAADGTGTLCHDTTISFILTNTPVTGERCFTSPTVPGTVWAKSTWTTNPGAGTVTIRTTFAKTFVDNTYGTSVVGWPVSHSFSNLTGSDKLGWSIKDANGVVKLAFEQDYISSSASFPSGYGTLGFGGDGGNPTVGATTDVVSFKSSLDYNFNDLNYVLTTNSPTTDANYTPNPTYPNWVYDVWYEVTVKLSTFGAAGFGYPDIATVHASPSKTGNNTEIVDPTSCIGSIGDYVWKDSNGNGIQDAGEPVFAGVTVTLTKPDNTTVTAVTDASGLYIFPNLSAGSYTVTFPTTLAGGYSLTTSNQGGDDTKDSDPVSNTGIAAGVVLYPGQINTTVDAGYVLSNLSLGNQVFFDANRSGLYDAGDGTIANLPVNLYKDDNNDNVADGGVIATTTTNATGNYAFNNLAPGNYIVGVAIPATYGITVINGGDPDNNIDNDNNAINIVNGEARGLSINLASGAEPTGGNTNNTYDVGFYNPSLPPNGGQGCYTGTNPVVYAKSYWNVNQNSQTVTMRVTFAKTFVDNTYGTSVIGWPGSHSFSNLTGSDHLIWSVKDANGVVKLAFKQDYVSADASRPSGYGCLGFGGDGGTPTVGLPTDVLSFRSSMDANFNDYGYNIGTYANDYIVNSPVTDNNYTPNTSTPNWIYEVWYEITVKQSVFGAPGFGSIDVASVHASPSKTGNNTEAVTSVPCTDGSIGNFVWNDLNNNGIQDAGEPGIPGVIVTLTKPNATTVNDTTDVNGLYLFTNLGAGTYTVAFATPNTFTPSLSNQGAIDSVDSDPVNGIVSVTITGSENNLTIDAGFVQVVNVGNHVWYDRNNNGTKDVGEPAIVGATVNLYLDANNDNVPDGAAIATTSTIAGGAYAFNNLLPNNYIVGVVIPNGYTVQSINGGDPDNNTDNDNNGVTLVGGEVRSNSVTLTSGTEPSTDGDGTNGNLTVDFGFKGIGSIGDFVFVDSNGNGIQDGGELGISGATVTLTYPDGSTITTTTDGNGLYSFTNLAPTEPGQSYTVAFTTPSGYTPTTSNVGGNDAVDSDPIGGIVSGITLNPGQSNTTIDAGFYQLLSLGNFVWDDKNNNGIQDAGEPGINGATVNLYKDANGDNIPDGAAIGTTLTAGGGLYGFGSLAPGNYIVGVVIPAGHVVSSTTATSATPNNDNLLDNNGVATISGELRSNFITLVSALEPTNDGDGNLANQTLDFGLRSIASLGDKVWRDDDKDGVQDAGEPGISGITVSLFDNTGKLVGNTVTDAYGNYLFSNLPAGDYTVSVTLPANYTFTPSTGTSETNATNSDVSAITGNTTTITLSPGENQLNIDAGIIFNIPPATANIGDRVWLDIDKDGIQDAGEPGIAGVTVTLYDNTGAIVATAVTDANGNYLFTNVPPGTGYTIGFTAPAGTVFSPKDATGDTNDSDADPLTGRTAPFTVVAGTTDLSFDAGLSPQIATKASLGDKVWNDIDRDGIQDANEPGIAGVTVRLLASNGTTVLATTTTDAFGNYIFTNLDAGSYIVEFVKPSGYTSSPKDAGTDDTKDSDADIATGKTALIVLAAGDRNTTVDAGMYITTPPGTLQLGDKVFNDENRDGVQGATEDGVAGVTVILYQNGPDGLPGTADDVKLKSTSTDVNGNYIFTDLAASTAASTYYNVQFSNLPSGYSFTTQDQTLGGGNDTNDSDPNPVTGRTSSINLTATNLTIDAGIVQGIPAGKGSLGDRVWYDMPGGTTGVQDATEQGVSGVTVKLYRDANNDGVISGAELTAIATTTTNALGNYMFGGLDAGMYQVGFSTLPAGFTLTTKDAGTDDAKDSDGNGLGLGVSGNTPAAGTSYTGFINLAQGEDNLTVDLGIVPPANTNSLGGDVWKDSNNDGVQTPGEQPVKGVMVTLYNAAGDPIATTVTDENGRYLFVGLPDGSYSVGFSSLPAGYNFTNQSATNDATGSDANVTTGRTPAVTLGPGNRNDTSLDAGLVTTRAALGNYVWFDANGNGTQDATESGIAGVTVTLTRPGFGLDGTAGNADDALPVATAITDANGGYFFGNLAVGNYVVNFATIPTNTVFTQQNTPGDNQNNTNSDANPANGNSASIALSAGETDLTIDAGVKPNLPGAVGNFVWNDLDADGIQDANEPGVAGVLVTLYNSANQPIGSAITDGNGAYLITNVPAGTGYYVVFSNLPGGAIFTTQDQTAGGGNDTNDSDANPTTGATGSITVIAGETNTTVDAGIRTNYLNLGNYVWYDKNSNGLQDIGELGLPTIPVNLYTDNNSDNIPDGPVVATTSTNASGFYGFSNLAPGNYIVSVIANTASQGLAPSFTTTSSLNPNNNNNVDNNGITIIGTEIRSNLITLSAAAEPDTPEDGDGTNGNLTVDFGVKGTGALGNFVWYDTDRDGIQDAGELGIANVTVTLTYPDGNTATTVTDANGAYKFENLVPGTYSVSFTTPAGLTPTQSNTGGNDETDSDPVAGTVSNIVITAGEIDNSVDAGFHNICSSIIRGNVWHDVDGMDDGFVDSASVGPKAPIPTGLRASLIDLNTGLVVKNSLVSGLGLFQFNNVTPGSYYILISSVNGVVGQLAQNTVLPNGWTYTGEKLGTGPGRDLLTNGKLNITMGYECISNANFGIKLNNNDVGID